MRKLFWIGSPFFARALKDCGWDVYAHNFEHATIYRWDDIVAMADGPPDVVVVADKSRSPFVLGMEQFPCLTVFYSVDAHIHSWHPLYAQGFDACIVSLRDHMASMGGVFLPEERIWWSPAFAKADDVPATATPEWDVLFVGTVDARTTPERFRFLHTLKEHIPGLHVTRGNYRALYPKARLVLNFCERGDLNFRVFEALGCGSCLLTPDIGNGQSELFTNGTHLVTYPQRTEEAVEFLSAHIPDLLADDTRRNAIARAGLEAVNRGHRAAHRATAFSEHIRSLDVAALQKRRMRNAPAIHSGALKLLYLLLAETETSPTLKAAYLAAGTGKHP